MWGVTHSTVNDGVPGIIRINSKGRKNSSFSFRSPESSLSHPQPHAPFLCLTWYTAKRSWTSEGLPVLFFHDCCEQGRSGWVYLANPGPLQKGQRRKFKKNSHQVCCRWQGIQLAYWMKWPEMMHREIRPLLRTIFAEDLDPGPFRSEDLGRPFNLYAEGGSEFCFASLLRIRLKIFFCRG